MATKSKRATVKDLRNGKTLYLVSCVCGDRAYKVEKITVGSVFSNNIGSFFTQGNKHLVLDETNSFKKLGVGVCRSYYLSDNSIDNIGREYNFHRAFTTYKAAKRYFDRINSGCLTNEERAKSHKFLQQQKELLDDDEYFYDYYGELY